MGIKIWIGGKNGRFRRKAMYVHMYFRLQNKEETQKEDTTQKEDEEGKEKEEKEKESCSCESRLM